METATRSSTLPALQAPAIACTGLTYTYPGAGAPALRALEIAIGQGELCLLVGGTGAGKSTFLRAACGLVPHFHGGRFGGRMEVCGQDTRTSAPAQLGHLVGALFQDPETQLICATVRGELQLAAEGRGLKGAAAARAIEEVALALAIGDLLEHPTAVLSGGEAQRVALGAALIGRPRLVLLDEPTSQLDPVAGDELIGLLRRLNADLGLTIVLSEHRIERCLADVDRVIVLDRGELVHDGPPRAFLDYAAAKAPSLLPSGARTFALAGRTRLPLGVKEARLELARFARAGQRPRASASPNAAGAPGRARANAPVLALEAVWQELRDGPAILCGATLALSAGERVALMGRNGAGKSTLLRHAAGLMRPTRGRVKSSGRVALMLQNPGDYLIHERVCQEASAAALAAAGLGELRDRNPRDLSGGQRQRLALAIVCDSPTPPAVLALDEPTRGMDGRAREELVALLLGRAAEGQAVIVATHDPQLAAAFAERVVLMAEGRVIADGRPEEILAGGWYFATEVARIFADLTVAQTPLLPEQGAELLAQPARADAHDPNGAPRAGAPL
jgi:energy-coupling factor transporter ATP-binding protein EcfA2